MISEVKKRREDAAKKRAEEVTWNWDLEAHFCGFAAMWAIWPRLRNRHQRRMQKQSEELLWIFSAMATILSGNAVSCFFLLQKKCPPLRMKNLKEVMGKADDDKDSKDAKDAKESKEAQELLWWCLVSRARVHKDVGCLKKLKKVLQDV